MSDAEVEKLELAFDCDGVMCDWHGGFIALAESRGHVLIKDHPQDTYAMHTWFEDMTDEQFLELVVEFNSEPEHISHMKPLKDAQEVISKLAEEGHTLCVLTAGGDDAKTVATRKQMIENLFPNCFSEIRVIGLRESKKKHLRDINPDLYIEDNIEHARSSIELLIPTLVIGTTYNGGHDDIVYVGDNQKPWSWVYHAVRMISREGVALHTELIENLQKLRVS
tara:strand:- start:22 stop:690 length:669 start_codon:yes stop_codon:yes gene_type:complete